MKTKEAAEMLGITQQTIRAYLAKRILRGKWLRAGAVRKTLFVSRDSVQKFMELSEPAPATPMKVQRINRSEREAAMRQLRKLGFKV